MLRAFLTFRGSDVAMTGPGSRKESCVSPLKGASMRPDWRSGKVASGLCLSAPARQPEIQRSADSKFKIQQREDCSYGGGMGGHGKNRKNFGHKSVANKPLHPPGARIAYLHVFVGSRA